MRPRRRARVFALQMLYQADMTSDPIGAVQERFWKTTTAKAEIKAFANILVEGTQKYITKIDPVIRKAAATSWPVHRMPTVDRCLLRSATYEILFLVDIPATVSINEAIELSKKYSTEDSPKFINAVLDKIKDMACNTVDLEDFNTSRGER